MTLKTHFISYPKSGRTWVRYALTLLGADQRILFHHDGFEFNDGACPPHDFALAPRLEKYRRIDRLIYLERDPRDVMCSLYHQVTGRFHDFFDYQGSLSDFLRDSYFGAENLHRFRQMWAEICQHLPVHRLSYEAMTADPAQTLADLTRFLGHDFTPDDIAAAVAGASFDSMKQVEQDGRFEKPWLRPRMGHAKVRRGQVGGFRDTLSPADIAYLSGVFGLT